MELDERYIDMSDKKVALFLANGCEEIEALTVSDILYRAGIPCTSVSITDDTKVVSSHKITIIADTTIDQLNWEEYTMLVLPGGVPGTPNLEACEVLMEHVQEFAADENRYVAAICAAPSILAHLGLLDGRQATCNPCVTDELAAGGAVTMEQAVVRDGNLITSRAFGTAIPFGLTILEVLTSQENAMQMSEKILYTSHRPHITLR